MAWVDQANLFHKDLLIDPLIVLAPKAYVAVDDMKGYQNIHLLCLPVQHILQEICSANLIGVCLGRLTRFALTFLISLA